MIILNWTPVTGIRIMVTKRVCDRGNGASSCANKLGTILEVNRYVRGHIFLIVIVDGHPGPHTNGTWSIYADDCDPYITSNREGMIYLLKK
jgi:hypothetical protein